MAGDGRPGWAYYFALLLFLGVLTFAVLGLVRSSSGAGAVTGPPRGQSPTPTPSRISLASDRVPTPEIPPSTPGVPTEPPSRTYLYPPPELAVTAAPGPLGQPRR